MEQSGRSTARAKLADMEEVRLEWRSYHRPFRQPLRTRYGEWRDRTGILLKLTAANGQISYGEIAPLSWFGSETMEQTLNICQQMPDQISQSSINSIPEGFPACQFGFESAWDSLVNNVVLAEPLPISGLLPPGKAALTEWKPLWEAGYRTFKWKIGVEELPQELEWFRELKQSLPIGVCFRLDANGGLTIAQAVQWLEACDLLSVEYLEQPLPTHEFKTMLSLQVDYATTIALDESVATLSQLQQCVEAGWNGVVVIKPAIAGSPAKLRQLCQNYEVDAVFSSVFETAIGRQAGLQLAAELGNRDRATGYGTLHWFDRDMQDFEELWQHL